MFPGLARGEVDWSLAPGTSSVWTLVREEEVKLGTGAHGVLAEGMLIAEIVGDEAG